MTQNNETKIVNSWSLLAFAGSHGKMQVGEFANHDTGEVFKSCIFTSPVDQSHLFVAFSKKLGELSAREIAALKEELQVVELNTGSFHLCRQGQNAWEDVDLGL